MKGAGNHAFATFLRLSNDEMALIFTTYTPGYYQPEIPKGYATIVDSSQTNSEFQY